MSWPLLFVINISENKLNDEVTILISPTALANLRKRKKEERNIQI